jgi:hypothetical protein
MDISIGPGEFVCRERRWIRSTLGNKCVPGWIAIIGRIGGTTQVPEKSSLMWAKQRGTRHEEEQNHGVKTVTSVPLRPV